MATRALAMIGIVALLAGCATTPAPMRLQIPEPRLSPAAFGAEVSLAQRLTFEAAASSQQPTRSLDAQLEIDALQVRLAAVAMGTRILSLTWDGSRLDVQRHPQLPAQVDPARVLRDVQFAYWPSDAVRRALPAGWSLQDSDQQRQLLHHGEVVLSIHYQAEPRWDGDLKLDNRVEGYRLAIQSSVLDASTP